jgi:magnesium chelatase family protein
MMLSGRAVDRILRVSRTVADLDGSDQISAEHVLCAITHRASERVADAA